MSKKSPSDFLSQIVGKPVVVKLSTGVDYRGKSVDVLRLRFSFNAYYLHYTGILVCLDGYMNIAMEQTEEYVNGQLKGKYGDSFIRGNNGTWVFTMVD